MNSFAYDVEGFITTDAGKAAIAAVANHGAGEAAQRAQLFLPEVSKPPCVMHDRRIQRAHRIQPEQLEPRHAQMRSIEHVVAQAVRSEEAAVAHAVIQDIPGVGKVSLIFPEDAQHFAVVMRLGLADEAEGDQTGKPSIVGFRTIHALDSRQFCFSRSSASTAKNCSGSLFEIAVL